MNRTRYYVGLVTRAGEPVSPEAQERLADEVSSHYGGGCTIYRTIGYWQSTREASLVFEVLGEIECLDCDTPEDLGRLLARLADQSAVLWTSEEVKGSSVKRGSTPDNQRLTGPCVKCGQPGFSRVILGRSAVLCFYCSWRCPLPEKGASQ